MPDTFDDGLSSFFQRVTEYVEEEKRNKEKLGELKKIEQKEEVETTEEPVEVIKDCVKAHGFNSQQVQGNMKGGCKEFFVKEVGGDGYTVTIEKEKV